MERGRTTAAGDDTDADDDDDNDVGVVPLDDATRGVAGTVSACGATVIGAFVPLCIHSCTSVPQVSSAARDDAPPFTLKMNE